MKAQNILHEQFPLIDGFLSTSLGMVGQLPVMKSEFIQILHTSKFHWVCVSSLGNTSKNTADVNLYDSLYRGITPETKKQIASLLFSPEKKINVAVPNVQQQGSNLDCGVFAIAFATSLCFGKDPSTLHFNRREMRQHLYKCLINQRFTMFPAHPKHGGSPGQKASFDIYCLCRQPWDQVKKMVQCDNCSKWYHQTCEQVPDSLFRNSAAKKWICSACKNEA